MKLGVIGPKTTVQVIEDVVKSYLLDVELVCRISEFYETAPQFAQELQQMPDVDALLFTGPTNYGYAKMACQPTIPWGHLFHNRASLQEALLKAVSLYGNDLHAISIDRYDAALLQEVLLDIGIKDPRITKAEGDFEHPHFKKRLLDFHRNNYRQGLSTLCLTSMEHIVEPLLEEGIPCIRIFPSREAVEEQIYHLRMMCLSHRENKGQFAIVIVRFDYVFDNEEDLFAREWKKMQYQNEFRKMIYTIAQQLEGAVFGDGSDKLYITTSRHMLLNVFLKTSIHYHLLAFGRQSEHHNIWVGMGIGSSMLAARSQAAMAMNHALADTAGRSYLAEWGKQLIPLDSQEESQCHSLAMDLQYLAKKLHVSADTLLKLSAILKYKGDTTTPEQLAAHMGITPRSVNRLILHLEDEGLVTIVGKQSCGKGRPARLLKISLPTFESPIP